MAEAEQAEGDLAAQVQGMSKYKLVILGEQSVGKTALITRFMFDTFDSKYQTTIGIDFLSKTLHLDDRTIRLQLWDTAGQERFRSLIPSYIRDSYVALIVYDVTDRASFGHVDKWVQDVREERGTDVVIMVIGNKIDLEEKREVPTEEGKTKASELDVLFCEASAKSGKNVKSLFQEVARKLPGVAAAAPGNGTLVDVQLEASPPPKKGCDC
jgi:small GTP-binding protein